MKTGKRVCAVCAAVLLAGLILFACAVPTAAADPLYANAAPALFGGGERLTLGAAAYAYYSGMSAAQPDGTTRAAVMAVERQYTDADGNPLYDVVLDSRYKPGYIYRDITAAAYEQACAYERQTGTRLLWPILDKHDTLDANVGTPLTDESGAPVLSVDSAGGAMRRVRVFYADWVTYRSGRAPYFLLGTDSEGRDVAADIAAALRTAALYAVCAAAAAVLAGWLYGVLFGRLHRFGRLFDAAAAVLSVAFAALCARYLPSRVGDTAALACALAGLWWLWSAVRCRLRVRAGVRPRAVWRTAVAAAVQAGTAAVVSGTVLEAVGLFETAGFGGLLLRGAQSAPHALWLPLAAVVLLTAALAAAGVAAGEQKKGR